MLALAVLLAATTEASASGELRDVRDLSDLSERAVAAEDVGKLQVGRDGQLTATADKIRVAAPLPFLRNIQAVAHGTSVEIREGLTGMIVRAGQLWLPTGSEAARPAFYVFDHRPGWFWTANQPRKMGVQVTYRPWRQVGLTVGAYNESGTFRIGGALLRDAIGRAEIDFGRVQAGAFGLVGSVLRFGESTRFGLDARTRLGPLDLSGQVVRGAFLGVEQAGWYVRASREIAPGTTLIARIDEQNPDLGTYRGLDAHGLLAVQRQVSPGQTVRFNVQLGMADPVRPQAVFPSLWAVIGQVYQRF